MIFKTFYCKNIVIIKLNSVLRYNVCIDYTKCKMHINFKNSKAELNIKVVIMLANSADIDNLEDFIMTVARSRDIFNLKSYSLKIISDYSKFFNIILPKDVSDILIVLPISRDDLGNTIKNELTKIRTSCSILVLYSSKLQKDRMAVGFR